MTDDRIALRELLEKGSDASFLREMISFAAECAATIRMVESVNLDEVRRGRPEGGRSPTVG